jgi:hypothetical protein
MKILTYVSVFSLVFCGLVIATTPKSIPAGISGDSYGVSSTELGVLDGDFVLEGWTPIPMGPSSPIDKKPILKGADETLVPKGPAQPINKLVTTKSTSNYCCYRYYNNDYYRYYNNGYYNYNGYYYVCGQPIRNVVRFFCYRRPLRRLLGCH